MKSRQAGRPSWVQTLVCPGAEEFAVAFNERIALIS